MSTTDLLRRTSHIEFAKTRRTLERVPEDRPGWTPHPRSMPLGRLAMHVARLPDLITLCLSTPGFDAATGQAPDLTFNSREHLLSTFDESAARLHDALALVTEQDLGQPWEFSLGDRVFSRESRAVTILHMGLGHLIHHRAQLGTYLRLNDLPLPPLYGPSADERPLLQPKQHGPQTNQPETAYDHL